MNHKFIGGSLVSLMISSAAYADVCNATFAVSESKVEPSLYVTFTVTGQDPNSQIITVVSPDQVFQNSKKSLVQFSCDPKIRYQITASYGTQSTGIKSMVSGPSTTQASDLKCYYPAPDQYIQLGGNNINNILVTYPRSFACLDPGVQASNRKNFPEASLQLK